MSSGPKKLLVFSVFIWNINDVINIIHTLLAFVVLSSPIRKFLSIRLANQKSAGTFYLAAAVVSRAIGQE